MNRIVDIHSHILFGIDDGSESVEESILIIKKMIDCGYTDIILTPHYIEDSNYNANNKKKSTKFTKLKKAVKEEELEVNLYLGNEIYVAKDIEKLIKDKEVLTLDKSKYILFELPLTENMRSAKNIIFELISADYHLILAHPERYTYFQEDPKEYGAYLDMGVKFQGNIDSMSGANGKRAKKLFKKMLRKGYYTYLASDVHHEDSTFFPNYLKNMKKIKRRIGAKKFRELVQTNPLKIIEKD